MGQEKKQLIMLNLFRGDSGEILSADDERKKDYFITDYFDWIEVEEPEWDAVGLADCMGIGKADRPGISHQRYCLYKKDNSEDSKNMFATMDDLPLLTIIQVFVNPDLYQCVRFKDETKVSKQTCMSKVKKLISDYKSKSSKFEFDVYSLLTEGDFAVVVRSADFHVAYNVSSLIRAIRIRGEKVKDEAVFYSYSISGSAIPTHENGISETVSGNEWAKYLSANDRVVIRIGFSQSFRQEKENEKNARQKLLEFGDRLLGRYDYQIECNREEFETIYPVLLNFKLGNMEAVGSVKIEGQKSEKVATIIWLIQQGYVSRLNERLLLKYSYEEFKEDKSGEIWEIEEPCEKEWKRLYEVNLDKINQLKKREKEIKGEVEKYYPYERNLKEYLRLLSRFCRVFYEINKLRELRVGLAVLLKQFGVFLNSINHYLIVQDNKVKEESVYPEQIADVLAENLEMGIRTLEIYTRYIRNINLQTLQTPNYDLQTNVCVEKILLAYSQFLVPFMKYTSTESYPSLSNTLCPVVVPVMGITDLSVAVLFDDAHDSDIDRPKLMAVNSPTFRNLCETCFLIPIIFHEIAHQFRYEKRESRNECLKSYILKSFIFDVVIGLIGAKETYSLERDEMVCKAVDEIYSQMIDGRYDIVRLDGSQCLEGFRNGLTDNIWRYIWLVRNRHETLRGQVLRYIEKAKENICDYDQKMTKAIQGLLSVLEENAEENTKEEERLSLVKNKLFDLEKAQRKQLFVAIDSVLCEIEKVKLERIHGFQEQYTRIKEKEERKTICDTDRIALFEEWNKVREDKEWERKGLKQSRKILEHLLKKYHSQVINCRDITQKIQANSFVRDKDAVNDVEQFNCEIYKIIKENLEETVRKRNENLCWETSAMSTETLEKIIGKIKMKNQETLDKELEIVLNDLEEDVENHVDSIIEMYREVTSDLFMCAIMGLTVFGYLVVVAEYFEFREENREGLLTRIYWVLQCLAYGETFEEYLNARWTEQKELLEKEKAADVGGRKSHSTQKWIERIYAKVEWIIDQVKGRQLSSRVIGEKEMFEDLIGKESYYSSKDKLTEKLGTGSLQKLCEGIAEILNSPAKFYRQKKSLLEAEIEFIFEHYEKSCQDIWER